MPLWEHDDDEDVWQEGDGEDGGHDEAVDGDGQLPRAVPGRAVDVVAAALVPALAQGVNLELIFLREGKWRCVCCTVFNAKTKLHKIKIGSWYLNFFRKKSVWGFFCPFFIRITS